MSLPNGSFTHPDKHSEDHENITSTPHVDNNNSTNSQNLDSTISSTTPNVDAPQVESNNDTDNKNSNNNVSGITGVTGSTETTNINNIPVIVNYTLNEIINQTGLEIKNQQGTSSDGTEITKTIFNTTNPNDNLQISENLVGIVEVNDINDSMSNQILNDIKLYAGKIQCSDFHGKGTIDDYTEIFQAASRIANESKQMTLDIDIEGFNEFGQAADDLGKLFTSFIVKLENVNIINDISFLTSISIALKKIYNLSEIFGKFKETISATATIKIPKSISETKTVIEEVMGEINCAMKYIGHFVGTSTDPLVDANLSVDEQNIINQAVVTIDNWNTLSEHGVSIAMSNNSDIQYIKNANNDLKNSTISLQNATTALKNKLYQFNIT